MRKYSITHDFRMISESLIFTIRGYYFTRMLLNCVSETEKKNNCIAECYHGSFVLQNVENYQNYEKRPSGLGSESHVWEDIRIMWDANRTMVDLE